MLKNSLARRVFSDMGMDGLSKYLEGPSAVAWGGEGIAELAKEISTQVKTLKKPADQGGGGRRRGRRPGAGRGHHQAAQPRGLDRPGARALARAGAADAVAADLAGQRPLIGQLEALVKKQARRSEAEPTPAAGEPAEPADAGAGVPSPPALLRAARHRDVNSTG